MIGHDSVENCRPNPPGMAPVTTTGPSYVASWIVPPVLNDAMDGDPEMAWWRPFQTDESRLIRCWSGWCWWRWVSAVFMMSRCWWMQFPNAGPACSWCCSRAPDVAVVLTMQLMVATAQLWDFCSLALGGLWLLNGQWRRGPLWTGCHVRGRLRETSGDYACWPPTHRN